MKRCGQDFEKRIFMMGELVGDLINELQLVFSTGFRDGFNTEKYTKRDYPIGGIAQRTVGYER